ncbi:hypothetical protein B0F90DRAFT_178637 [Multifurca ochricompacta]|uniref:EF-hand domain-containing protein n=1 Tax=Multifurca ochricompacta TaxID=376703 RepID=A0AAD4M705_9AGAM|nr:hypothetical protein B0F90DRAFT_178637 [Multifurca ochricompacta]
MPTIIQRLTGSVKKKEQKEQRRRYGPTLGIPNQVPPNQPPSEPLHPYSPQPDDEHLAWFIAIDQDNSGQVSAEELQSALMNGYGGKRFSADTVNYLMSIFDLDGSGEIGIEEFKPLWDYVRQWRVMFDSFDDNQDGIIDAGELANALNHYDLHVGPAIIDILVRKYGTYPSMPSGGRMNKGLPQIELDRFVCACVVVQQMCVLYERCNAGQVSRDEFLLSILRLP